MRLFYCSIFLAFGVSPIVQAQPAVYAPWPFNGKEAARRQAETAKALGTPVHLSIDLGNGVPLKLVLIPAGKFMMGSPDTETIDLPKPGTRRTNESPQHEVTITRPYYMSMYKITQEQYEQIMGKNPSVFPGKNFPVHNVMWDDAVLFCKRASGKTKRTVHLPTEAQWEYAARAGTASRYFFGDDESKIGDYAWYHENSKGTTHPVGQKIPNAWGLFDVLGLSWEYCSDFYADSFAGAGAVDPIGPATGTTHPTRGGTFGSRPPFVRTAVRGVSPEGEAPPDMLSRFGFRVAVDLGVAKTAL